MTPAEVRAARHALGMTHRQFGAALGVQEQTARRWEIAEGKTSNRKPSPQTLTLLGQMVAKAQKAAQKQRFPAPAQEPSA